MKADFGKKLLFRFLSILSPMSPVSTQVREIPILYGYYDDENEDHFAEDDLDA